MISQTCYITDSNQSDLVCYIIETPSKCIQYLDGVGWCRPTQSEFTQFHCSICYNQFIQISNMLEQDRNEFLKKNNLSLNDFVYDNHPTMINKDGKTICVCPSLNKRLPHASGKGKIGCFHCKQNDNPHTWNYCHFNSNRKDLNVGWELIA